MFRTRICDILGIEYPIFQGSMARISESDLASSVSNAGGLGVIAASNAPIDYVRGQIKRTYDLTDKPFALNIMLLSETKDDLIQLAIDMKVKIVVTSAGYPGSYVSVLKKAGIKVMPVIASVAQAKRVQKSGADAVIAEGAEAGGHIGELNTMALVPQVVDAVDIPVVAAGGIADGRGFVAALALGAEGVQMGTRFLVSKDCTIHANYKDKIIQAKDISTVVTGRSTGHPVRVLKNNLAKKMMALEKGDISFEEFEKLGIGALAKAVEGDIDHGSFMAGQSAGLVKKEQTSQEIIEEIIKEAVEVIEKLQKFNR